MENIEKHVILLMLEQSGGNQSRAAKMLGIGRDALRYKMQKFGISSQEAKSSFETVNSLSETTQTYDSDALNHP